MCMAIKCTWVTNVHVIIKGYVVFMLACEWKDLSIPCDSMEIPIHEKCRVLIAIVDWLAMNRSQQVVQDLCYPLEWRNANDLLIMTLPKDQYMKNVKCWRWLICNEWIMSSLRIFILHWIDKRQMIIWLKCGLLMVVVDQLGVNQSYQVLGSLFSIKFTTCNWVHDNDTMKRSIREESGVLMVIDLQWMDCAEFEDFNFSHWIVWSKTDKW